MRSRLRRDPVVALVLLLAASAVALLYAPFAHGAVLVLAGLIAAVAIADMMLLSAQPQRRAQIRMKRQLRSIAKRPLVRNDILTDPETKVRFIVEPQVINLNLVALDPHVPDDPTHVERLIATRYPLGWLSSWIFPAALVSYTAPFDQDLVDVDVLRELRRQTRRTSVADVTEQDYRELRAKLDRAVAAAIENPPHAGG